MNELLTIHDDPAYPVDGRELHQQLGIKTAYKDWFPRMCEYGFGDPQDYCSKMSVRSDGLAGKQRTDHHLTLSMAKEICMIQRTEIGRQIRRYLIEVENAWNTPEQIMARALRVADDTIGKLTGQVKHLEATNARLSVDCQIMAPKAEYFDAVVDRNLLTSFRETAKLLEVKERTLISYLIDHGYIYRDAKGKLMPYAGKHDGLFEVKECINDKTSWSGTQTLVTPRGRETFRLLMQGM